MYVVRLLDARKTQFQMIDLQRQERDPSKALERGYAIAYDATGRVLRSADQVAVGEDISVRLAKGALDATVKRRRPK